MIRFRYLDITSFKSIFHITLDFSAIENKFYSLEGINNTVDFAKSNGAGKSSIGDAISYALYGTTMGIYIKKEDYQNKNTKIPMKIILEFDVILANKANTYKIERTLNNTILYKNDEDISELNKTETEKKLANILNLTKEEFFSFTYLTQYAGGNFLGKTASEKLAVIKDFIFGEELLNIKNKIDNLLKETDKQYKQHSNDISRIEGNIESLQKIVNNYNKNNEDLSHINITKDIMDKNRNRILELQKQQIDIRAYEQKKQRYELELNGLKQQMLKLKQQFEKVKDNICPTCGQHLNSNDVEISIKQEVKNIKMKAITTKQNITNIINILQQYGDKISISKELDTLTKINNKYETLQEINNNQQQIEQEIIEKTNQQNVLKDKITILQQKQKQIKELQKYFNTTFIQYVQQSFLSEIENYLNLYCYETFNENFTLKFYNNSLELFIGEHPYSYFSGGERQRIDLLFVFAVKVALNSFTDKCTNIIIFDESLSGSDSVAFNNTVELIDRLSASSNLTTILVSHKENTNVSSNKIILERYNNKNILNIINN